MESRIIAILRSLERQLANQLVVRDKDLHELINEIGNYETISLIIIICKLPQSECSNQAGGKSCGYPVNCKCGMFRYEVWIATYRYRRILVLLYNNEGTIVRRVIPFGQMLKPTQWLFFYPSNFPYCYMRSRWTTHKAWYGSALGRRSASNSWPSNGTQRIRKRMNIYGIEFAAINRNIFSNTIIISHQTSEFAHWCPLH